MRFGRVSGSCFLDAMCDLSFPVDGYEIEHDGLCTTVCHGLKSRCVGLADICLSKVFSAPNYVDVSGNKGAFVSPCISSWLIYLTDD
jgi:hypothetical protein